jgi:hypothetical protein
MNWKPDSAKARKGFLINQIYIKKSNSYSMENARENTGTAELVNNLPWICRQPKRPYHKKGLIFLGILS